MRQKKPTRRFDATEQTIYRDLRATIIKLQATSLRVDYDLLGGDPTVRIYFDRNGKRYVSECRQWSHFLDNLRAAQLAIEYTYRIGEAYGVNYNEVRHHDLFDRDICRVGSTNRPKCTTYGQRQRVVGGVRN